MGSTAHPDALDPQTLRELIDELHLAVRENRVAVNTLTAEFGHWRKEPRLRTLIDTMQSELDSHQRAIERLTVELAGLREELQMVKGSATASK